jgi:class 3 adenylate cyclase
MDADCATTSATSATSATTTPIPSIPSAWSIMICPNCQTSNPANAKFCIECGQPLPRVCAVCGASNPPGARFCNQCGTPLPAAADGGYASQETAPNEQGQAERATAGLKAASPPAGSRRRARTAATPATVQAEASPAAAPHVGDTGAEHAEERRVVTMLFADITSSTALADGMDAEDVRALLGGFFATMTREIHRHGGTVEKYIGDAVMAVFGLPVAHEDDPVRAVRAALDMQAALRLYNEERAAADVAAPELKMRIGINTGEVVAAAAAAEGGDFLITGDAVNVAARLQQAAAPGTILIGPRTYRATVGAVVLRALASVRVRGKAAPLRAWQALALLDPSAAPMPRPRGVQGLRAPLVGRDLELSLLQTVHTRVTSERRPHLVTILGAPGIGKTRLAREFVTAAVGACEPGKQPLVLDGRCPQYGEAVTYWPLAEMLRALCGFTALEPAASARAKLVDKVRETLRAAGRTEDPEVLAAYLGYTIGIESAKRRQALLPGDSQQLQEGLLRAWRVIFEALAAPCGLIVLIDDIHWADGALLDLLEYVAERASGVPLLLLCPARPELLERRPEWGGGKRNYVMLSLEALPPHDADRLVRALLPGEGVPESLRQGILRKGEGNPFFFEEIIRMLADRGILTHDGEGNASWRVAPEWEDSAEVTDPVIPDTVQGVLAARLDLLAEPERDMLQHAAVIGRSFWPGALRNLHPRQEDDLGEVLSALEAKDLIRESERPEASVAPPGEPLYTFTHALTREVTYATIPRTRRAHEHQRVAEWLEELARGREAEFADLIAQHYSRYYQQANLARARNSARRQAVRAKVIYYLVLAGDQAASRHAAGKAERYFTEALTLLEDESLIEDVPRRVELFVKRGETYWAQLRGDAAWDDYREALRLWSAYSAFMVVDGSPKADVPAVEASVSAPIGADGALAALAAAPIDQGAPLSLPLDWRAWGLRLYRALVLLPSRSPSLFQQPPTHEELLPYLQEGLRLVDELGLRETLDGAALLAAQAFYWWSWPEQRGERELLDALHGAQEAVRIADALDDPKSASEALDALGNIQAITTDLRGNLESQTRRLHWARRLDEVAELVDIQAEVGMANTLTGNFATAVEHARLALELATAADADILRMRALRSLTLAYFESDRWPETIRSGEHLQQVARGNLYPQTPHHRWALLAWAIALARTGERDAADALTRRVSMAADRAEEQYVELFKARLALARGALKEARQLLISAVEARSGRFILPALLAEVAELGARTGDRALFDRYSAQALELGWRSGARKARAQAMRARGIVGIADEQWDEAQDDLQCALDRYIELGAPWEEARTRYALSGLYQRRGAAGDAELARMELTRALALFEQQKAVRDIARARAALAGGEVRLPQGTPGASYG